MAEFAAAPRAGRFGDDRSREGSEARRVDRVRAELTALDAPLSDLASPDVLADGETRAGGSSSVPGNWFVDPVALGVPGVRPGLDDENPLAWQTDALCAQTDPESFFPEKGGSTRDAKRVCSSCDVRSECLEYALQNDERFGIWGGLSERERRKLKRRAV